MSARARFVGGVVLAGSIAGALVSIAACGPTPDPNRVTNIYTPADAFEQFAGGGTKVGVNGFLAARCATLDCHGQLGRPLRLFSESGLRIVDDAGDYPGGAPATSTEIFANFTAAISVQPELTSEVFAGNLDPPRPLAAPQASPTGATQRRPGVAAGRRRRHLSDELAGERIHCQQPGGGLHRLRHRGGHPLSPGSGPR